MILGLPEITVITVLSAIAITFFLLILWGLKFPDVED